MGDSRQFEKKWKCLMEHSISLVLFFDQNGNVIDANENAKRELGYDKQLFGVSIDEIFPKILQYRDGQMIFADSMIQNSVEEGKSIETVAYRQNQTCFDVDLKILPCEEEGIGLCSFVNTSAKVGAIKDMVKAKEKVEMATKVQNEFVSNVTHELRTPVNGILGISKNLMETQLDQQQEESLRIIHMCCKNMIEIINNLLDFAKLEAGKFTLEEREFSFREAIDKIIAMNMNQVNEKGLKLLLNISPEIPERVIGDELRISQILTNLINNAVKFTSMGQIVVDIVKTMEVNDTVE